MEPAAEIFDPNERAGIRRQIASAKVKIYRKIKYAIINAIPHEFASTMAVFGAAEVMPHPRDSSVRIEYLTLEDRLGERFYVAVAGTTGQGIAQAAAATALIKSRCEFVRKVILIGIAAGQENLRDMEKDVRLGDVVIGNKLIQYDHVKRTNGEIELRGDDLPPGDKQLLNAVDRLLSLQERKGAPAQPKPWDDYISRGGEAIRSANRPNVSNDPNSSLRKYEKGLMYERTFDKPHIHVGTIGSASTLLKDSSYRNDLARKHGTIAYEMEGAGVAIAASMTGLGYLNVRGICDYGDNRKSDDWQTYASVCAAAVARAILEEIHSI
ncbi:5'-methylthioadenosine/S-adenosylhomocysteine nucleosidase family protein [Rhizobium terrae]|uniref:5'-methylthioadenosine/S-adenosylhomocysteine nucleosidase family protein n=1 Tax=Rhizobium terrae TaxID=2171756 RepID=UPI001D03080F|nr:phosphorylase [Rhizobium terrae]